MEWVILAILFLLLALCIFYVGQCYVAEEKRRQEREKNRVENMRMLLEENRPKIPVWWLRDPNEPLERLPDETEEQFRQRLDDLILDGGITPNGVRKSLGFEPFPNKPADTEVKK